MLKFGIEEKTAQIAALAVAEIRDLNRTLEYIEMGEKERRGTIWRTLSWYSLDVDEEVCSVGK